jgi:hypothetical protein
VFVLRSGQNMDDLLAARGYEAYVSGYVVDFLPIIVRDFGPANIIDFWTSDFRSDQPQLRTRRQLRFGEPGLPIFSPLYREIGIAYQFNAATQRHYYVIIFAAEPNDLPVVVTQRGAISQIAQTVADPAVILYIHDERVNRFGEGDTMGAIERMRISEDAATLDCADVNHPEWQPYEIEVLWQLSPGSGRKTLYIQMCDDRNRGLVSSTQVELIDSSDLPDIAGAVRATQTQAAEATAFAPYVPTVEAILTATAAAP